MISLQMDMNEFWSWARSIPWFGWVAIVAIICGCITGIVKMIFKHQEDMERIRQGDNSSYSESAKPPKPKI